MEPIVVNKSEETTKLIPPRRRSDANKDPKGLGWFIDKESLKRSSSDSTIASQNNKLLRIVEYSSYKDAQANTLRNVIEKEASGEKSESISSFQPSQQKEEEEQERDAFLKRENYFTLIGNSRSPTHSLADREELEQPNLVNKEPTLPSGKSEMEYWKEVLISLSSSLLFCIKWMIFRRWKEKRSGEESTHSKKRNSLRI